LFRKPLKTSFGLLSEPGGDFPIYSFIARKMFSRKMMLKRDKQLEVAWSKVGAMRRMLENFPFEISQRLICLVGSTLSCNSNTPLVRSETKRVSMQSKHPASPAKKGT
jgi:hypothetical protein